MYVIRFDYGVLAAENIGNNQRDGICPYVIESVCRIGKVGCCAISEIPKIPDNIDTSSGMTELRSHSGTTRLRRSGEVCLGLEYFDELVTCDTGLTAVLGGRGQCDTV